jgi:ABC-type antimicrobial peptide transport system permease subunit
MSYGVSRRRREFGIRMALGSSPQAIGALVLRDGIGAAAIGIGCGSVLAWVLARAMASLQYGVSTSDSGTWLVVLGVIGVTTIAAAWRPAVEAMRTDPIPLLREE